MTSRTWRDACRGRDIRKAPFCLLKSHSANQLGAASFAVGSPFPSDLEGHHSRSLIAHPLLPEIISEIMIRNGPTFFKIVILLINNITIWISEGESAANLIIPLECPIQDRGQQRVHLRHKVPLPACFHSTPRIQPSTWARVRSCGSSGGLRNRGNESSMSARRNHAATE